LTQKLDITEEGIVNTVDSDLFFSSNSFNPLDSRYDSNAKFQVEEFADPGLVTFTDSLGRTATSSVYIMGVFGHFGQFSKYGSFGNTIADQATQQQIGAYAINSTGETATFSSTLTSTTQVPNSFTLNFTFATSGATGSVVLDLSGVEFQSYDSGRSSQRPTAIGFTNILNRYSARRSINTVKNRIEDLSALEGRYGALISRLSVAHNVLGAAGENFAAASSRIKDANIAAESTVAIRAGILQQSAASVLAQANQAPQVALSLLQNI
jgi:flagellin-like hook-associated protein FlgL